MDLGEFLLARIAEDEADAAQWHYTSAGGYDRGRVLAECVAKRAILEIASPGGDVAAVAEQMRGEAWPDEVIAVVQPIAEQFEQAVDHSMQVVLKCLALPYSKHPDYCPEWKAA